MSFRLVAVSVDYERLREEHAARVPLTEIAAALSDGWATGYREAADRASELVEIALGQLTYLFDLAAERVVGVTGWSAPARSPRPESRMRGFPLPPSVDGVVRGHLVAHQLGGGTDINLVPQYGRLNVSARWRRFERWAAAHPGCLLAIEVVYSDDSQTPAGFVYLVADIGQLFYDRFDNFPAPEPG